MLKKAALFLLPVLFLSACATDGSNGEIIIKNNNINLKEIPMSHGKVSAYFSLENTSSEPVRVIQGQTSCMCTEAIFELNGKSSASMGMHGKTFINQEVRPGDTAIVTAIFDPNAHGPNATGPIARDIFLETNSQIAPELRLSFSGLVIK